MDETTPARLYALVVGASLLAGGVMGFFYESGFTTDKSVREPVLGLLDVNGWHNVVHLSTGLLGLIMAGAAARSYALLMGVAYTGVAIWGFILGSGDSILSIIPVNTEDNILHVLIAVTGLVAFAATRREPLGAAA